MRSKTTIIILSVLIATLGCGSDDNKKKGSFVVSGETAEELSEAQIDSAVVNQPADQAMPSMETMGAVGEQEQLADQLESMLEQSDDDSMLADEGESDASFDDEMQAEEEFVEEVATDAADQQSSGMMTGSGLASDSYDEAADPEAPTTGDHPEDAGDQSKAGQPYSAGDAAMVEDDTDSGAEAVAHLLEEQQLVVTRLVELQQVLMPVSEAIKVERVRIAPIVQPLKQERGFLVDARREIKAEIRDIKQCNLSRAEKRELIAPLRAQQRALTQSIKQFSEEIKSAQSDLRDLRQAWRALKPERDERKELRRQYREIKREIRALIHH